VPAEEESNSPPHDSKNDTRLPFSTGARAAFMPDPVRRRLGEAVMRYWDSILAIQQFCWTFRFLTTRGMSGCALFSMHDFDEVTS
jgi:hypothetical protein